MTAPSGSLEERLPPFEVGYELYAADVYRFCLAQLRNPDARRRRNG